MLEARFVHDHTRLKRVASMLKTISNPIRLRIINLLIERGRMNVKRIYEVIGISQSNASQHLKALEHVGVLDSEREGKNIYYKVCNPQMIHLLQCVDKCVVV